MRKLVIWDAGHEAPLESFQADLLMAAAAALHAGEGRLRLWSRSQPALSVGRYHRMPRDVAGMQRRLSGGRIVPVGPGVLGVTFAATGAWLQPGGPVLRPDQILNRALRPILAVLRENGADAFYPGRDVVTVGGRVILYAAFCPFADDVLIVEQHLALTSSFAELPSLLARLDPEGVSGVDREAFNDATTLADVVDVPSRSALLERLAAAAGERFACEIERSPACPDESTTTRAEQAAYSSFQSERGPLATGRATASTISMLGLIEATARAAKGHIHDVEITGDLIAPFATIELLQQACEGEIASPERLRARVTEVLAEPGSFVLGATDLGELLARLA